MYDIIYYFLFINRKITFLPCLVSGELTTRFSLPPKMISGQSSQILTHIADNAPKVHHTSSPSSTSVAAAATSTTTTTTATSTSASTCTSPLTAKNLSPSSSSSGLLRRTSANGLGSYYPSEMVREGSMGGLLSTTATVGGYQLSRQQQQHQQEQQQQQQQQQQNLHQYVSSKAVSFGKNTDTVGDGIATAELVQQSSPGSSIGNGGGGGGGTSVNGSVDGREFFRMARSTLSYDAFTTLLANVKAYNAKEQSRQRTLDNLLMLLGERHRDLFEQFEMLLAR